jgi:cytochrome c biogenesis protein ResB
VRKLLDALASLRLTLVLLVALAALFLAGLALPQKQLLGREAYEAWQRESPGLVALLDGAGLTEIYGSWLAKGLWLLFFANLVVVMVRRVPVVRERIRIDRDVSDPRSAPGLGARRAVRLREGGAEALPAFLRGRRLALFSQGGRLRAVRYRFAPAATLAFHLSFFLIAAGGYLSAVTRFEGSVDLGVGEQFTGDPRQYAPTPRLPRWGDPPRARFVVEGIEPQFERDVPVGIRVHVRDAEMLSHVIEINRPYRVGDAAFVFRNLGVAPLLVVQDASGREVFGGYARLDVLQGRKAPLELLGQQFEAELFPEYAVEGGQERTRSRQMLDPVLRLTLRSRTGRTVAASLHPGEAMLLGPYSVTFADWRYWVRLYVRSERGIGLLWFGFGLAAVALATRLFLYRREWVLEVERGEGGAVLHVAGRSEYYRALFDDEMDALERRLRSALGAGEPGGAAAPPDQPPPASDARETTGA